MIRPRADDYCTETTGHLSHPTHRARPASYLPYTACCWHFCRRGSLQLLPWLRSQKLPCEAGSWLSDVSPATCTVLSQHLLWNTMEAPSGHSATPTTGIKHICCFCHTLLPWLPFTLPMYSHLPGFSWMSTLLSNVSSTPGSSASPISAWAQPHRKAFECNTSQIFAPLPFLPFFFTVSLLSWFYPSHYLHFRKPFSDSPWLPPYHMLPRSFEVRQPSAQVSAITQCLLKISRRNPYQVLAKSQTVIKHHVKIIGLVKLQLLMQLLFFFLRCCVYTPAPLGLPFCPWRVSAFWLFIIFAGNSDWPGVPYWVVSPSSAWHRSGLLHDTHPFSASLKPAFSSSLHLPGLILSISIINASVTATKGFYDFAL